MVGLALGAEAAPVCAFCVCKPCSRRAALSVSCSTLNLWTNYRGSPGFRTYRRITATLGSRCDDKPC